MIFKFPNIVYEYNKPNPIKIKLTPESGINIINELGNILHIVVIYNIEMTINEITESCKIPYYLSDGHTNNFRANMLLPFFGFNINEVNSSMPVSETLIEGTLFKNNLVKNIDMKALQNYIINQLKDNIIKDGADPNRIIELMENKSNNNTVGVLTVLSRIKNLLDFIIAVNSEMLLSELSPLYYIPIRDRNNRYNFNVKNETGIYPSGQQIGKEDNVFRDILIRELKYQNEMLKNLGLFNVNLIELDISLRRTPKEFNNRILLCKDRVFNQESIDNFKRYVNISQSLFNSFKQKIYEKYNFIKYYSTLLLPSSLDSPIEMNFIAFGEARCKKKYLKYKAKYLKLKLSINNHPQ